MHCRCCFTEETRNHPRPLSRRSLPVVIITTSNDKTHGCPCFTKEEPKTFKNVPRVVQPVINKRPRFPSLFAGHRTQSSLCSGGRCCLLTAPVHVPLLRLYRDTCRSSISGLSPSRNKSSGNPQCPFYIRSDSKKCFLLANFTT